MSLHNRRLAPSTTEELKGASVTRSVFNCRQTRVGKHQYFALSKGCHSLLFPRFRVGFRVAIMRSEQAVTI